MKQYFTSCRITLHILLAWLSFSSSLTHATQTEEYKPTDPNADRNTGIVYGAGRADNYLCTNKDAVATNPNMPIGPGMPDGRQRQCNKPGVQAADPIDVSRGAINENVLDFSLPVKHGMQLPVRRIYSNWYFDDCNRDGIAPLGYSKGDHVNGNWYLYLYESRVRPAMYDQPYIRDTTLDPETYPANQWGLWNGDNGQPTWVFVTPDGGWIHFMQDFTMLDASSPPRPTQPRFTNIATSYTLHFPDKTLEQMQGDQIKWTSVYKPVGSVECSAAGYFANRQTDEDITLYVLHDVDPRTITTEADSYMYYRGGDAYLNPDHIKGFIIRYNDGRQFYYNKDGYLIYVDANWRNNKPADDPAYVDDFLTVTWTPTNLYDYSYATENLTNNENQADPSIPTIYMLDKVYAPPSDGRYLKFNHDGSVNVEVTSVDLFCRDASGQDTNHYDHLIEYAYRTSSYSVGKLWRVKVGTNSNHAVQYDYGTIEWSGNTPNVNESLNNGVANILDSASAWLGYPICRISDVTLDGGNINTVSTVSNTDIQVVNEVTVQPSGTENRIIDIIQWNRDPDDPSGTMTWRKSVTYEGLTGEISTGVWQRNTLAFGGGEVRGSDPVIRYSDDYTVTSYEMTGSHDIVNYKPDKGISPAPITTPRLVRHHYQLAKYASTPNDDYKYDSGDDRAYYTSKRVVNMEQVLNGTDPDQTTPDPWLTTKMFYYDIYNPHNYHDSLGHLIEKTGINKPTRIVQFLEPGNTTDPNLQLVTDYKYEDPDFKDLLTQIDYPYGGRETFTYDRSGQVLTHTIQQQDSASGNYLTLLSETYTYVTTSGELYGLLATASITSKGATKNYTYAYHTGRNLGAGGRSGQISAVTVDNQTTQYTYDDFGHIKSVAPNGELTILEYSGPGSSIDTMVPPRLVKSTNPEGVVTQYAYNDWGKLASVTFDAGGSNKVTAYEYDRYGNTTRVSPAGEGTTESHYDIYGNMIQRSGAQTGSGSGAYHSLTKYKYDSYGRMYQAQVFAADGATCFYTMKYTYVSAGSAGGDCSACGGGLNALAMMEIFPGDGSNDSQREAIYYKYDSQGRLVNQGLVQGPATLPANYDDYTFVYDGKDLVRIDHKPGTTAALWGSGNFAFQYDSLHRLTRETYPNGRYIEYTHDDVNRLASVKDPFGFINKVSYNDDGGIYSLQHSTLGTAYFGYDTYFHHQTDLTLGNGAKTFYGYDAHYRLQSFEHYDQNWNLFLRHVWKYDALGRKNFDPTDSTDPNDPYGVTFPALDPHKLAYDIVYDEASRLKTETLKSPEYIQDLDIYGYPTGDPYPTGNYNNIYQNQYGYDAAGNRTNSNGLTLGYTGTGAGQNRETTAPNNRNLQYDYKGNVRSRTSLANGGIYTYAWNSYNQLTRVAPPGGNPVDYTYDALGRLIKRSQQGGVTTVNYWLGNNKLAEERWGSEAGASSVVFRPDPNETGDDPLANGWGGSTYISTYENDPIRGKVARLRATTTGLYDLNATIGNLGYLPYTDGAFYQTGKGHVGFWVKQNKPGQEFSFQIEVKGASGTYHHIAYRSVNGSDYYDSPSHWVGCYMGTASIDGQWHYIEVDFATKLTQLSGDTVAEVNAFRLRGNDLSVDDIVFSGGSMLRDYLVVPGAELSGVLGSYVRDSANNEYKTYYQYNELGTVVTTTDENGNATSIMEPDYYGNYRYVWGTPQDNLGLNGKFYDEAAELYYYGARWYDPERGRWMSEEPLGLDGPNPYHFVFNDPVNGFDMDGLATTLMYKLKIVNNVVGGVGDGLTLGLTGMYRRHFLNGGDTVNYCSGAYTAGEFSGEMLRDTLVMAGAAKGIQVLGKAAAAETAALEEVELQLAKNGARATECGLPGACFIAGTLVETADGQKPIEEVQAGDLVWSYDTENDTMSYAPVEKTYTREAQRLIDLTVVDAQGKEAVITGTPEHPFYVPARHDYLPLGLLKAGMVLQSADGSPVTVKKTWPRHGQFTVYNFEVQDAHNYFVAAANSGSEVLVHNAPCPPSTIWNTSITGPNSITNIATDINASQFQANLQSSGYNIIKTTIGKNGPVTILSNGSKTYTIYTATSTGQASAQVFDALGNALVKIRLLP